jgi:HSP20 family protein
MSATWASREAGMKVRCRKVQSVLEEIDVVHQRIAARAQRLFHERGGAVGRAIEDWLIAERETVWRPALEVRRTGDAFVIEAAVAGLDAKQIDLQVTPTELVLAADVHHTDGKAGDVVLCEFVKGPLFRSFTFPAPVDPARVAADYRTGLLRITAPLAHPSTRVAIEAA